MRKRVVATRYRELKPTATGGSSLCDCGRERSAASYSSDFIARIVSSTSASAV